MSMPSPAPHRTILVTGATGFLGGAVCRLLAAHGWKIIATGRNAARLAALAADGAHTLAGDMSEAAFVAGLPPATAIVHCAALSSPWGRRSDFQSANVDATAHIIAHARRVRADRLVHISSPTVYHSSRPQFGITERAPWPRRAVNHYAASKRVTEKLVRVSGLTAVILRPRALFGPGDTVLLPRIIRAAREGRLPVIGSGQAVTDLTYIDNAAEAVRLSLEFPLPAGVVEDFNITNDEPVPLWPTLSTLLARLGLPPPARRVPLAFMRTAGRLAEVLACFTGREPALTRYGAEVLALSQTFDIAKARALLGYQPKISVREGIEAFAASWKKTALHQ
jgi:nucleoside-diphosphate-sugar epimerase